MSRIVTFSNSETMQDHDKRVHIEDFVRDSFLNDRSHLGFRKNVELKSAKLRKPVSGGTKRERLNLWKAERERINNDFEAHRVRLAEQQEVLVNLVEADMANVSYDDPEWDFLLKKSIERLGKNTQKEFDYSES